mmetsp:Transcript_12768/g.22981  ORF Transcript_12768/g.22981 Transcript_12768/m.22981 type:complete len:90 (+) Transcript_12768:210-479(+)
MVWGARWHIEWSALNSWVAAFMAWDRGRLQSSALAGGFKQLGGLELVHLVCVWWCGVYGGICFQCWLRWQCNVSAAWFSRLVEFMQVIG